MKKKILFILSLLLTSLMEINFLTACGKINEISTEKNGWEDLTGWEDDPDADNSSSEIVLPSFNYNGYNWTWIGAEETYYVGEAIFENYYEEGAESARPILTNLQNSSISFVVNSSSVCDARLIVRLAVDTGWNFIWASDKFSLSINGQDINLNGTEGNSEKWLWQQANYWWYNANYIDANFGSIHLLNGKNTFVLSTKSGNIQLDCFAICPL